MPSATASPCSSRLENPVSVFKRMAEGVAEIEQRPLALLALVGGDDRGLHAAAGHHGVPERLGLERAQRIALAFAPGEEFGVADQPVFDGLGIAGEQFAPRQGGQVAVSASTRRG